MKNILLLSLFISLSNFIYSQDTTSLDSSFTKNNSDTLKENSISKGIPDKADLLGAQLSKVIIQQNKKIDIQTSEIERLKNEINSLDLSLKDARRLKFIGIGSGIILTGIGGVLLNSDTETDRNLGSGFLISGVVTVTIFDLFAWYSIGSN